MKVLELASIVEEGKSVKAVQITIEKPSDRDYAALRAQSEGGTRVFVDGEHLDVLIKKGVPGLAVGLQVRCGSSIKYIPADKDYPGNHSLIELNFQKGFVPDQGLHLPECPGRVHVERDAVSDSDHNFYGDSILNSHYDS
jgi:hypothetical protein